MAFAIKSGKIAITCLSESQQPLTCFVGKHYSLGDPLPQGIVRNGKLAGIEFTAFADGKVEIKEQYIWETPYLKELEDLPQGHYFPEIVYSRPSDVIDVDFRQTLDDNGKYLGPHEPKIRRHLNKEWREGTTLITLSSPAYEMEAKNGAVNFQLGSWLYEIERRNVVLRKTKREDGSFSYWGEVPKSQVVREREKLFNAAMERMAPLQIGDAIRRFHAKNWADNEIRRRYLDLGGNVFIDRKWISPS